MTVKMITGVDKQKNITIKSWIDVHVETKNRHYGAHTGWDRTRRYKS